MTLMSVTPQNVTLGGGVQVGVLPLFNGHHCIWASGFTQADICNNADDLVVLDCMTGRKHRFPITAEFLPWLRQLIEQMDVCDQVAGSPWSEHNALIRRVLFLSAERVEKDDPPQLNILNPPLVAPYVGSFRTEVDDLIAARIGEEPESLIA